MPLYRPIVAIPSNQGNSPITMNTYNRLQSPLYLAGVVHIIDNVILPPTMPVAKMPAAPRRLRKGAN